MINTTRAFDKIGLTIPVESKAKLRAFALLRLGFVCIALYVCLMQLFQIGVWSSTIDRILVLLGCSAGVGRYGDGLERAWTSTKPIVRLCALLLMVLVLIGSWTFTNALLSSIVPFLLFITLLVTTGYGLVRVLDTPLRTARFRQLEKYVRTLPRSKRREERKWLSFDFRMLLAEGFD